MTVWLSYLLQAIFILITLSFGVYVALELRVLLISRRAERRKLAEFDAPAVIAPAVDRRVSVLLPIHNESSVVERLIDAVCAMRYPAGLLEILVLDDSTDRTSALARRCVERHAARGLAIRLLRRTDRKGHKAGNLVHGMRSSTGEFFAVFDADFLPPADFLLKCIPCFDDPDLGFLQTGIGYENSGASFLTRFQAMELGHQQYVTVGLSEDGDMASLSGSSCVWRRACIDELGGWNADTITEDVDLGYRAQFGAWKYAYLRDVVSMSILPETISAFRIQRERWGRGLIHSGFKHVRKMFHQRMPLLKRMHAIAMMFSSVLLASIYALVLLSLPLNYLIDFDRLGIRIGAAVFLVLATVWSLDNAFGARKGARLQDRPSLALMLWHNYLYIAMFLPMAWYYFAGGIRALFGVYGEFNRTPKGGDETRAPLPRINTVLLAGEILTFCYSLLAVALTLADANYILAPLPLTACVGFGMVLYWSWQEHRQRMG